ncbi:MAG: chitobiase/beta-hexosaminidase C-terminal domain-containing protein [Armatimonadota bacterium]
MFRFIKRLSLIVCLLPLLVNHANAGLVPYDPAKMSFPVRVYRAMETARTWIGNQNLDLKLTGVYIAGNGTLHDLTNYIFTNMQSNQKIKVNCYSNQVTEWVDKTLLAAYDAKDRNNLDRSARLPVAELNGLVRHFLETKYPDFVNANLQQEIIDDPSSYYVQRLPNGAWYPRNRAAVKIDDWTGEIIGYAADFGKPPTISTAYNTTSFEAEKAALDYIWKKGHKSKASIKSAFVWRNKGVWVDIPEDRKERLVWLIDVAVSDEAGITPATYWDGGNGEQFMVILDANSLKVIEIANRDIYLEDFDIKSPATPVFTPDGGTYTGQQTVTISCATDGSTIRYTTDGTTPTTSSTLYSAPVSITSSETLRARAWHPSYRSSMVKSAVYSIR